MPVAAFLLEFVETPEDYAFTVGETVSDIGEIVTRITVLPVRVSESHTLLQLVWLWLESQQIIRRHIQRPC